MSMLDALPAVNAVFNGVTALCLLAGFVAIKAGRRQLHRAFMLCAFGAATIFLIGYLVHTLAAGNTHFASHGPWRTAYLAVLFSHMFLAVVVLPLILRTLYLGLKSRFSQHRPWAVWTWPLWVYVSVTGVLVYLMLFHLPSSWTAASAVIVP
jgi:putative membrane protein